MLSETPAPRHRQSPVTARATIVSSFVENGAPASLRDLVGRCLDPDPKRDAAERVAGFAAIAGVLATHSNATTWQPFVEAKALLQADAEIFKQAESGKPEALEAARVLLDKISDDVYVLY